MERKRRKKGRRLVFAGAGFLAAFLAVGGVYFLSHSKRTRAAVSAQAISVNASKGTLSATIVGSGHLQSAEAQKIQVPVGLSIETVAVEAGDTVSAGDVLALVDETALTAEIAQIQSVISKLDGQLSEKAGDTEPQTVTSKVEGRVKEIYAETGDAVADVMVSEGALLLLSLDGKMAVQIQDAAGTGTTAGSTVSVALSSGTTVSGTVESATDSTVTVTLTDEGTSLGDTVTVSDSSGQAWGTGILYVHQPLEITGTSGQVSAVHVTEGQWVEAGEDLLTLTDVPVSAEYQELFAARAVYKEKLRELLAVADGCAVTAPVDGVIESVGLTEGSTTAASSDGNTSKDETSSESGSASIPATGMATSVQKAQDIYQQSTSQMYPIRLDTVLSATLSTTLNTTSNTSVAQASEETLSKEADISGDQDDAPEPPSDVSENAQGVEGGGETQRQSEESGGEQQDKGEEQVNAQNEVKEESQQISGSQQGTGQQETGQAQVFQQETDQKTDQIQIVQQSAAGVQEVSDNSAADVDDTDDISQDTLNIADVQSLQEQVTGFTIAVQDHMILSVDIDELDILSVEEGQEVEITMDAAEGKIFSGEVTKVSDSTSGSDGSAKYTVEVTVPKDDLMRVGMSASATIVTEKKENVVVIPADAVQERGREVFVYTQYDPQSGALSGEKEIQTGMSDGQKVEITSGLAEGDIVYYKKTESQPSEEGSRTEQQMDGMRGFDMNGGGHPDGGSGGGMPGGSAPGGAPGRSGGQ